MLDNIEAYVDAWAGAGNGETFHWQADVDPDQLEYLTNSLHDLDLRLADRARQYPGRAEPTEGVEFHVVLVEALLNALAQEGPSHAAFAEQLRREWPVVTATTS